MIFISTFKDRSVKKSKGKGSIKKFTALYHSAFIRCYFSLIFFFICVDVKSAVKTQEAEAKRQNALAEKWKTLQEQKCAIANALKVPYLSNIVFQNVCNL